MIFITLFRYFTIVLFFTLHFFSFSQGMQTRERAHCARSVFPFIKKKEKKIFFFFLLFFSFCLHCPFSAFFFFFFSSSFGFRFCSGCSVLLRSSLAFLLLGFVFAGCSFSSFCGSVSFLLFSSPSLAVYCWCATRLWCGCGSRFFSSSSVCSTFFLCLLVSSL